MTLCAAVARAVKRRLLAELCRTGEIRLAVTEDTTATTRDKVITDHVKPGSGVLTDDPKPLTSRSCSCRIERVCEIERFSVSRHGRAVRAVWVSPRPVRLQVGREKPVRGAPRARLAGQARMQMSIHVKVVGLALVQRGHVPACVRSRT
jgi:hypothetical protein